MAGGLRDEASVRIQELSDEREQVPAGSQIAERLERAQKLVGRQQERIEELEAKLVDAEHRLEEYAERERQRELFADDQGALLLAYRVALALLADVNKGVVTDLETLRRGAP